MSENAVQDQEVEVEPPKEEEHLETRVDEFAIGVFGTMGYKGRLPDKLVESYNNFKRVKDHMHPGRLSPEGFATVIALAKL
jgi:hypothetical protein